MKRCLLGAFALTAAFAVAQPSNVFPPDEAISVSPNPALEISCNENVVAGQFQIGRSADFGSLAYDSGTQTSAICNHVAFAALTRDTDYYWRARTQAANGTWSAWSLPTTFKTPAAALRIGRLELRDGVRGFADTADVDLRGSFADPSRALREWNQGLQNILRTGRRPSGSLTDEIFRTLLRFDLDQVTPATTVVSAYLELTGEGLHSDSVDFSQPSRAHQILVPWSEWNAAGSDNSCCGAVEEGEASWSFRSYPLRWNEPGAAGVEADRGFSPVFVTNFRNKLGDKTFSSGGDFVRSVQFWVDNPSENHGIVIQSSNESRQRTMNLASREYANAAYRPALVLELTVNELIDLEIAYPPLPQQPLVGQPFDFAIETRNQGPNAATGVMTQVSVPTEYDLTGHAADVGSFDPVTGVWSIPDLGPNQTARLILSGSYPSTEMEVLAAVTAADQLDADSYPGNFRVEDDAQSITVVLNNSGSGGGTTSVFSFDSGSEGFSYADDLFYGTNQPAYASGAYSSTGGYAGGGLVLNLGGVDGKTIQGMSGGWRYGFVLAQAATVEVSFRYRIRESGTYEGNECIAVLAAVDGLLAPGASPVAQICGNDPQTNRTQDTGWQPAVFQMQLGTGSHSLSIGGYNNQKTSRNESAQVFFDDVTLRVGIGTPPPATLVVSPSNISLSAVAGASASQALEVTTSTGAAATVSLSGNASWLQPIPAGPTPLSTQVAANTSGLSAGDYSAEVTLSATGYTSVIVPVTLVVSPAPTPALTVDRSTIALTLAAGESITTQLSVGTSDGTTVSYALTDDAGWLTPSATSASAPGTLALTANASGLAAGSYTATLMLSASGYTNATVTVNLTVASPPFETGFEAGLDGFVYIDDLFRGTSNPSFASGTRLASGGASGAGLQVTLGGGSGTVEHMSGGFRRTFVLDNDQFVTLMVRYRHLDSGTYENDECSQLLIAIDGVMLSTTSRDHLSEFCGNTPQSNLASDSGWRIFQVPLFLTAGSHAVDIGGYNNRKSSSNEQSRFRFDDVRLDSGARSVDALEVSQSSYACELPAGSSSNATVGVLQQAGGTVIFDLQSNAAWLALSSPSGTTPEVVGFAVNSSGLAAGIHTAVMRASAEGHNDTFVSVELTVR